MENIEQFEAFDSIDPIDTLQVIAYAILTTIFAEFGMWILIYSKDEYKQLKKNLESTSSKLNKQKDQQVVQSKQKNLEKKLSQIEQQFKTLNQEMTYYRLKSTFLIGIFMIITLSCFGSVFHQIVIAKLPFKPFFLIKGITHRGLIKFKQYQIGLLGEDYTDCSYIFLYILVAFIFRGNIQKLCGFEPPRTHNSFFMNPNMPKF